MVIINLPPVGIDRTHRSIRINIVAVKVDCSAITIYGAIVTIHLALIIVCDRPFIIDNAAWFHVFFNFSALVVVCNGAGIKEDAAIVIRYLAFILGNIAIASINISSFITEDRAGIDVDVTDIGKDRPVVRLDETG